ncbi:LamG domain-containing protein, partial [Candidatus Woesearchaeota archaeon]|nr:LamG domain-containing protein [Candidatus Woesearchaeota archaeon]
LDCGNDISLDFGEGDASISLWVKTTDVNGNILSKTSAGYGPGIKYSLANGWGGTSIAWFMDGTETSSNQYSYASEDINNGEWHFVVAVLNKEENKIRHYVDGHDVSTPVRDGPLGSISSQAKLLIGSSLFSGEVDEITLWNKALTQENIDELYLNGLQNCES